MKKFIDLHQDIVLSYEDKEELFFKDRIEVNEKYNAWTLNDYKDIDLVFSAVWPYHMSFDENGIRKCDYDSDLIEKYILGIKKLFGENIVLSLGDINKDSVSALIHIEGYDSCNNVEDIDAVYEKGVRSIWFVWNFDNAIAKCAVLDDKWGLSSLAYQCLDRMNELWMIVDTAHMSDKSMLDAIKYVKKPLINSHSNAFSIEAHPRNVSDDFLKELTRLWSCIGLSLYNKFVGDSSRDKFWLHVDYVVNLAGEECISLGTDFHGIPVSETVGWINNVSQFGLLYDQITKKYGSAFADKFMYTNAKRVLIDNLSW